MALQHLRSSTADKRPTPAAMSDGQLAMNTNLVSPGLFLKDSNGDLVKVGPVHVGTTAPNVTPGAGGQAGNSKGEQWLDTSSSRYVFKIWDGTAWRTEDGEFVNVSGDLMTGALGIIAGAAATPGLYFSGDTNTGIYSPDADQVAISTNGTGRLFVDSSGKVGIGTSSPSSKLYVSESSGLSPSLTYGATASATILGANVELAFGLDPVSPFSYWLQIRDSTNIARTLVINPLGGNVGIGTTSPGGALEINAAAATSPFIAKINTSEAVRIDSSGRLLVGTSTARSNFFNSIAPSQFQIEGTANDSFASQVRNSNNPNCTVHILAKSRGTTVGSNTIVQSADQLGQISFQGSDGTEFAEGALIAAEVDGTPGANDMPGRLVFSTTPDGSATPTERLRITSAGVLQVADAGNITVGTTTGTKIGTATTQKIGFYDATPVVQPTAVADATDAATVITQLNALLTRMRNLGLIAT
jgi:hypothetical protein